MGSGNSKGSGSPKRDSYNKLVETGDLKDEAKIKKALSDPNKDIRKAAAEELGGHGVDAAAYAPNIAELLSDEDRAGVRRAAAMALSKMGPEGAKGLASKLGHEDPFVREACAWGLSKQGVGAASQSGALAQRLADPEASVRRMVGEAFMEIGPMAATEEVLKALGEALGDEDEFTRTNAAAALAKMGPQGVSTLVSKLNDSSKFAREMAAFGLAKIGADAAPHTLALLDRIKDPEPAVRKNVVDALGGAGQAVHPYIDELADHLHDMDRSVRQAVVQALGPDRLNSNLFIGAEDAANLADPDPTVRRAGAFALGEMGKGASYHLEAVAAHLEDPNKDVREGCNMALKKLGAFGMVWEGTTRAFNFYNNIDGTQFAGDKNWQRFVTVTEQDLLLQAAGARGKEQAEMAIRKTENDEWWQVVTIGGVKKAGAEGEAELVTVGGGGAPVVGGGVAPRDRPQ